MYHTLYKILVLTYFPTIPADLKALGEDQFQVREAATRRLEAHPLWTAEFFKYHAQKSKDPEIRLRCRRVYMVQEEKVNRIIVAFIEAWKRQKEWIGLKNELEQRKNFEMKKWKK